MVDADLDMAELSARGAQGWRAPSACRRDSITRPSCKGGVFADAVILCSDFLDEEAWKKDFESLDAVGLGKQVRLRGGSAARCRPCARSALSAIWRIRCARNVPARR
ncbi:MAG: hypothetical protein ACLUI3_10525 [Christensenellales bacterium]